MHFGVLGGLLHERNPIDRISDGIIDVIYASDATGNVLVLTHTVALNNPCTSCAQHVVAVTTCLNKLLPQRGYVTAA